MAWLRDTEQRQKDRVVESTSRLGRLQDRAFAWVVDRIAEQRLLWNLRGATAATVAHPNDMTFEQDTNEPTIGTGATNAFNHKLPQRSYWDISALWDINEMFSLRAGINNILDQDPPLVNNRISQTGSPNSYPSYDLLGRHMFVGVQARF